MGDTPPPFPACDRKEPYVFVSYAHADKADVYPDIQHLHGSGFRIWYDEGITPSEEWLENIAAAIDGCAMFVVFLSAAAVGSKWVPREISLAIERDKPFLAVHLAKTVLPSKLQLAIGIYQHVIRQGMPRDLYLGKVKVVLPASTNAGRSAAHSPKSSDRAPEEIEGIKTLDQKDYHGTALAAGEWAAMMDLERALGGEAIPAVQGVKFKTFGFSAERGHVVKLSLYQQGLTSLPETIGNLRSLQYLYLERNHLSFLPGTIWNLTELIALSLYGNKLRSLPGTIGNLQSLQRLYLSSNQLLSLPDTIGDLKSLTYLILVSNMLSTLPDTISNLKSLKFLSLSSNKLSSLPGTIKTWIKDLKKHGCEVVQ
jgi:hypothetical protein